MNFSERATARRKSKDLKNEMKQLKKELLAAGCEKGLVSVAVRDFGEALELGETLRTEYAVARRHIGGARAQIDRLLVCMGERPAEEVQEGFKSLMEELGKVYHDCLIRKDDPDFQSSVRGLRQMLAADEQADTTGMTAIMLRSELENVRAVLDDTIIRDAPDFFALAYFFLHADKDSLREMENRKRNLCVSVYTKQYFMDAFLQECGRAGAETKAQELIRKYTEDVQEPEGD